MKKLSVNLISQCQYLWRVLVLLYMPIILLFAAIGLWSRVDNKVSLDFLMQDIATTGELPSFAGFVSNIQNILWSASLTICIFALIILQRWSPGLKTSKRFLLQAGIVTFTLLLDDVFLFHGDIAPKYLKISESTVIAGYLAMGLLFVFSNRGEILSSEYVFLISALTLFGASIFLDALPTPDPITGYFWNKLELLLEDGLKSAAIVTWLTYFARYTMHHIEAIRLNVGTPDG